MRRQGLTLLRLAAVAIWIGSVAASANAAPAETSVSSPPVNGDWGGQTGDWNGSNDWSGSGSDEWSGDDFTLPSNIKAVRIAHAVVGAIAVLLILPFGGIYVRIFGQRHTHGPWIHAAIQIFGLCVYASAAGLGIWMATKYQITGKGNDYIKPKLYHPIIGMTLLAFLALQPFSSLANHFIFRKWPDNISKQKIGIRLAVFHLWFGRFLLIVGIVNGGLGFAFSDQFPDGHWSTAPRISYGTIATCTVTIYVFVVVLELFDKKEQVLFGERREPPRDEELQGLSQSPFGTESRPQTAQTAQTAQMGQSFPPTFRSGAL